MKRNASVFLTVPFFLVLVVLLSSCSSLLPKGDKGDPGDQGIPGVTGEAGSATILNLYYKVASAGTNVATVPEILDKMTSTFVKVYESYPSTPDLWHEITDGFTSTSIYYAISWSAGEVYVFNCTAGNNLMFMVYGTN